MANEKREPATQPARDVRKKILAETETVLVFGEAVPSNRIPEVLDAVEGLVGEAPFDRWPLEGAAPGSPPGPAQARFIDGIVNVALRGLGLSVQEEEKVHAAPAEGKWVGDGSDLRPGIIPQVRDEKGDV